MRIVHRLRVCATLALASGFAAYPQSQSSLTPDPGASIRDSLGGGSTTYRIDSSVLGETRRIAVATPPSYSKSQRRYPVVIAFDGESLFAPLWAAATHLMAAGQIPESIVVGVENTDRLRDLTPPGLSVSGGGLNMGGDRFLDFLERDLLPALARQFRGGEPVVLVGHSSGGILVTYAAATRDRFPWVVAIDVPAHLGDGWLGKRIAERTRKPAAGHLRYVSLEARFGWPERMWKELVAAAPPTWTLAKEKVARESHESMVLMAAYLGLRRVFEDYSAVGRPQTTAGRTFEHYAALERLYGAPIPPPLTALVNLVEDLLIEGKREQARQSFATLLQAYGPSASADALRVQIAEAMLRPPLKETVEDLLTAPRPSAAAAAPFLGEWKGESRSGEAPPNPVRLRLTAVNGILDGDWTSYPSPGVELVNKLDYIHLTGGGIHVGYRNGMRPRGIIVHELLLRDGALEGEFKMRGVDFQPPSGRAFPLIRTTLRQAQ
jgi:hypothetical protein